MTERRRFGVGARGAYLLTYGIMHVLLAVYLLTLPPLNVPGPGIAGPLPFLAALHVPAWAAAVPWALTGVLAIACAFVKRAGDDFAGFAALAAMQAAWGTVYAAGWAMYLLGLWGGPVPLASRALIGLFWCMSVGTIIVSKMVSARTVLGVVAVPDSKRAGGDA